MIEAPIVDQQRNPCCTPRPDLAGMCPCSSPLKPEMIEASSVLHETRSATGEPSKYQALQFLKCGHIGTISLVVFALV